MMGFKYICTIFNVRYKDIAEELGITKQTVNSWTSGRRPIPRKYISVLSEKFDIPKGYFQKEINHLDRLYIQKRKLSNEIKNIEVDDTIPDPDSNEKVQITTFLEDPFVVEEVDEMNYKMNVKVLVENINKTLNDNYSNSDILRFYSNITMLINNEKVSKDVMLDILRALEIHYFGGSDTDKFVNNIIKALEEREKNS